MNSFLNVYLTYQNFVVEVARKISNIIIIITNDLFNTFLLYDV